MIFEIKRLIVDLPNTKSIIIEKGRHVGLDRGFRNYFHYIHCISSVEEEWHFTSFFLNHKSLKTKRFSFRYGRFPLSTRYMNKAIIHIKCSWPRYILIFEIQESRVRTRLEEFILFCNPFPFLTYRTFLFSTRLLV